MYSIKHNLSTGPKKSAGVVSYNVHKNGKHAELISSSAAKKNWPKQVFYYLQKSIKMVTAPNPNNDIHQNAGKIDISKLECAENVDNLVGHPIKVCCELISNSSNVEFEKKIDVNVLFLFRCHRYS